MCSYTKTVHHRAHGHLQVMNRQNRRVNLPSGLKLVVVRVLDMKGDLNRPGRINFVHQLVMECISTNNWITYIAAELTNTCVQCKSKLCVYTVTVFQSQRPILDPAF